MAVSSSLVMRPTASFDCRAWGQGRCALPVGPAADNDETLSQWGKRFGVSPRNPFALLSHTGEDLQGAIQIAPGKVDDLEKRRCVPTHVRGAGRGLRRTAQEPRRHAVHPRRRIVQPGRRRAQEGALFRQRQMVRAAGRTPSTHILKPPIQGLASQVENEMFCQRLAPRLDLPSPKCWIEHSGDIAVIVIERFDRQRLAGRRLLPIDKAGGEVRRIHQEDWLPGPQVDPRNKYQRDGGPASRPSWSCSGLRLQLCHRRVRCPRKEPWAAAWSGRPLSSGAAL